MDTNANLTSLNVNVDVSASADDVRRVSRVHRDQYVHYSHQMTGDTADASARTLTRVVPVIYGAVLGGLVGSVASGVVFGLLMSLAFDLRMGDKSVSRPLLHPVFRLACPFVSPLLKALGIVGGGLGLPVPVRPRDARCDRS